MDEKNLIKITSADLDEYFKFKGIDEKCSSCAHAEWMLTYGGPPIVDGGIPNMGVGLLPLATTDYRQTEMAYIVIPMSCRHCGLVRLQAAGILLDWYNTKGTA
ncbi:hypothetical protein [Glaciimonas immobilis]|uniref:Uncharacterized protein n=1 Tax=Glaciimonas immobilis TaxID=728004 RepID=A0A840RVZ6_9BURK|nr:hypothetical protein [Glaciimonas immobilis]KAF3997481.1 hypothetical protein HAV38_12435 [Glaciimonas immobilis]MBB5200844.1 hypothetical protein [Glaciimonas immobilis]